jgi:hypothetical protein
MEKTTYYVLDLLVDGDSSFAALGVGLKKLYRDGETNVGALLCLLERMDTSGLIRLRQMNTDGSFRAVKSGDHEHWLRGYEEWVPRATTDEAACDEVGLWAAITPAGRSVWAEWCSRDEQ